MNQKMKARYAEAAAANSLVFDEANGSLFGAINGYSLCLTPGLNGQTVLFVSVNRMGNAPEASDMKAIVKTSKQLLSFVIRRYSVGFVMKRFSTKPAVMAQQVGEAVASVTDGLLQGGYTNCCQNCGQDKETAAYELEGAAVLVCSECFDHANTEADITQQKQAQKKENIFGGIVGALLGSLLGAVVIVILGQLGYVASLSGLVIAVCALKGYELLGGKLTNKGIVIACVMIVVMIYVSVRTDWALSLADMAEIDFFTAFRAIPELIRLELIDAKTFYTNLAMVYLFAAIGAVPTVLTSLKNRTISRTNGKMQERTGL